MRSAADARAFADEVDAAESLVAVAVAVFGGRLAELSQLVGGFGTVEQHLGIADVDPVLRGFAARIILQIGIEVLAQVGAADVAEVPAVHRTVETRDEH